jgi:uncharacterized protein (DUF924 family)
VTIDDPTLVDEILTFWFGDLVAYDDIDISKQAIWWAGSAALDTQIRDRFGETVQLALRGELDPVAASPRGALALVIVLDQFTRNVGRGTKAAFSGDAQALKICIRAIERGDDRALRPIERSFLYMPMMHAEDPRVARRSLETFAQLSKEIAALRRQGYPDFGSHAAAHAEIVERFGRYPHRNEILERRSTPDEAAFLSAGGPSFGQERKR